MTKPTPPASGPITEADCILSHIDPPASVSGEVVVVPRAQLLEIQDALQRIEAAPAWGAPEKWETTPTEVRRLARDRLRLVVELLAAAPKAATPIDMLLYCPKCGVQHVDEPDDRTPDWTNPPHRSHLCYGCGCIWRPADVPTNGVAAIATVGKADTWAAAPEAATPSTVDREAAIEQAAEYVLANSRRSNVSLNDEQRDADTQALMKAYRDIIGKALDSGALAVLETPSAVGGVDRMREALIECMRQLNAVRPRDGYDRAFQCNQALEKGRAALTTGETSPELREFRG